MTEQQTYSMVALVPMRHHSVRVSGKNYRTLVGKPLYAYILETLKQIEELDLIVVNTDSPVITAGIQERFPEVQLIERPDELLGEDVPMNEILLYDAQQVHSDTYLQTHSTNPLLTADTMRKAIRVFKDHSKEHDALFGVTRRHVRIWDSQGKPINHDPQKLEKTQDLPPFFEENSCVYIFERDALLSTHNRLGRNPMMFEVPKLESFDIDTEWDFRLVEALIDSGLDEASS
ncbi:MAG: acylneuraminate cytidylyltransferase family protein [Anaerolineales bacterium]